LQAFSLSQIQWSLAASDEEKFKQYGAVLMDDASYGWYLKRQMPVFAFSPQAHGFFSKAEKSGIAALDPGLRDCYGTAENFKRLEKVKALAKERGVPVSVPVLAYLMNNKLPCVPVFGATSKEMLYETLQAADYQMSPEEADALYHS
jgi:aryl-alcohol dehydrogenase-like predicted oxidoreductase